MTGSSYPIDPDNLAKALEDSRTRDDPEVIITREPKEAIVVLFDTSGSM
eukprot:CAMPEP_0201281512 /NCGR_PEP_ID=MMETSP1317-20130820/3037_1 /ASSEMBLY_ACC=CAM_ASM_000770 /TAXON_ID=187299 /ORGANISM="Undescribed Undescribed, Strain Undescribed" /LENGTH=48 /DNA_ID= /DNA_START= /DNA_END= /DNA_ORIENTATION=